MSGSARASLIVGILLILLGLVFLAGQFLNIGPYLWPFFVIAVGAGFFIGMAAGGRPLSGLAIPGSIITMIGLILLVQNALGIWETWAYAWALIVAAVGIGVMIHGWASGDREALRGGLHVLGIGFILFVVFGAFFELIVGFAWAQQGDVIVSWGRRIFWPAMLILAGLFIIFFWSGILRRGPSTARASDMLWSHKPDDEEGNS